ncbi:transcriptional regulator, TetR family [Gracilibacillus ureilyticus]|uniref:Transcriptional regulator, TetR family n=1 Tax=Gracilibacillus ureilyticus TaxID=531814 RepID=A0A1H9UU60_9BACI|nr:TetR/AcrR family transcriptional regulator [Gracilibacillus ureilyticus]SES12946.1 transcriptional regulator, TetR family [Gracilibacillus ureilyticus]
MSDKREDIIKAAHKLFVNKGFAKTSIQDILNEANIAKGTFYNYFDSKKDCLLAILNYINEEVEKKRYDLAKGKQLDDEEVFIQQIAVKMDINKQHNMFTVFETVSLSEDETLKKYMISRHKEELVWISRRLEAIYPQEAESITIDHAVMLIGITHHMSHASKLLGAEPVSTLSIITFALNRLKSMIQSQIDQSEVFLHKKWLTLPINENKVEKSHVFSTIDQLINEVDGHVDTKYIQSLQFLKEELEAKEPRIFLIDSIFTSLIVVFQHKKWEHKVNLLRNMVDSLTKKK